MKLIFDLGGVVLDWQPRRLLAQALPEHTATPEAIEQLFGRFFHGYGGEWGEFDRGALDAPALAAAVAARVGLSPEEVLRVVDSVPASLTPIAESVALLHDLKQAGHDLYYLSKMPTAFAAHLLREHAFFDCFDDGVFSCDVKLIKPEPAIYRHAEARFGLQAADCFFLDDHAPNIAAARAAGWQALHVVDPARTREALRALVAF